VTAPDALQVEPLKLTLEEALVRLGECGCTLAAYGRDGAPREYVLRDAYSPHVRGFFSHWKDAVEEALGVPVVPRDTAELVELLARMTYTARILHQNAPPAEDDAEVLALITAAEAALARVRREP
jgi:hypothetical protein